jgi:YebC/PmpR family DNA-binding regulatory protein
MSGHSKWATIKHKKGAVDKARGKLFAKLIRQVEVAARERAIKRGTGELEGVTYEQITYEGYAPHGVAVLIDVLTDNRNRSGSDIRSTLKKNGGSIAEPGAVSWQFERKGIIALPRSVDEDDLMLAALDAGLEDLIDEGDTWRLMCAPGDLPAVRVALDEAGIGFDSADTTMVSSTTVMLDTADVAKSVLRVIDALEEYDDVQDVYSNFDIPDEILQTGLDL